MSVVAIIILDSNNCFSLLLEPTSEQAIWTRKVVSSKSTACILPGVKDELFDRTGPEALAASLDWLSSKFPQQPDQAGTVKQLRAAADASWVEESALAPGWIRVVCEEAEKELIAGTLTPADFPKAFVVRRHAWRKIGLQRLRSLLCGGNVHLLEELPTTLEREAKRAYRAAKPNFRKCGSKDQMILSQAVVVADHVHPVVVHFATADKDLVADAHYVLKHNNFYAGLKSDNLLIKRIFPSAGQQQLLSLPTPAYAFPTSLAATVL